MTVIKQIRNSVFTRPFIGLMVLYLINISVDAADPAPEYLPEDLSFNEQESVVEIVLEKILGFEDAIKEYDDHDSNHHDNKKSTKLDLSVQPEVISKSNPAFFLKAKSSFASYTSVLADGFTKIDTPPPRF